jgi:hypothetical protein
MYTDMELAGQYATFFMGSIVVKVYIDKLAKPCTMTCIMQSKVDYIFEFTYSPKWRRSIAVPFDI